MLFGATHCKHFDQAALKLPNWPIWNAIATQFRPSDLSTFYRWHDDDVGTKKNASIWQIFPLGKREMKPLSKYLARHKVPQTHRLVCLTLTISKIHTLLPLPTITTGVWRWFISIFFFAALPSTKKKRKTLPEKAQVALLAPKPRPEVAHMWGGSFTFYPHTHMQRDHYCTFERNQRHSFSASRSKYLPAYVWVLFVCLHVCTYYLMLKKQRHESGEAKKTF